MLDRGRAPAAKGGTEEEKGDEEDLGGLHRAHAVLSRLFGDACRPLSPATVDALCPSGIDHAVRHRITQIETKSLSADAPRSRGSLLATSGGVLGTSSPPSGSWKTTTTGPLADILEDEYGQGGGWSGLRIRTPSSGRRG